MVDLEGASLVNDLISGVISSLLVVLFVEAYLRLRKVYRQRP